VVSITSNQNQKKVEKIELGEDYELLCSNPKVEREEKEELKLGRKVRVRLKEGQIVEGEIVEDWF